MCVLREQSGRGLEGRQRCKGGRNRSDRVMKETEERETERDEREREKERERERYWYSER